MCGTVYVLLPICCLLGYLLHCILLELLYLHNVHRLDLFWKRHQSHQLVLLSAKVLHVGSLPVHGVPKTSVHTPVGNSVPSAYTLPDLVPPFPSLVLVLVLVVVVVLVRVLFPDVHVGLARV